jgi:serine phosphatase RsbU (regulator of sigma subunit)
MLPGHPQSPQRTNRPGPFDAHQELAQLGGAQRRLLPRAAPLVPGYRLCLVYRPAFFATGDYHDFFLQAPAGPAAFVGDGSGHGPTACLLMATMRAILHTHPDLHRDPGATLTAAGRLFSLLVPADLFMTGLYLVLHEHGRVSWASAGQDPPLRVDGTGQVAPIELGPVGLPLGIQPEETYPTVTWELAPGERLLVFTDGLVEMRCPAWQEFGRRRLQACWGHLARFPLDEAVGALADRVTAHRGGAALDDDYTLLGIERDVAEAAARAGR